MLSDIWLDWDYFCKRKLLQACDSLNRFVFDEISINQYKVTLKEMSFETEFTKK